MMIIVVIINVIVISSVIKHKIYLYFGTFHLTKLLKIYSFDITMHRGIVSIWVSFLRVMS